MAFNVGDRVGHPARPEWGPGEILAVLGETKFTVYFALGGEKRLKDVALVRLTGPESSHPLLENRLRPVPKRGAKPRTLADMQESFLRQFPGGFEDDRYVKFERAYKVAARELLQKTMGAEELQRRVSAGDHGEVCRRALAVIGRTNLVAPDERAALHVAVAEENAPQFSRALPDLLYGADGSRDRFERFWKTLERIGAAKWTIATYFRFLAEPETEMFLSPEASKAAAEACGIELNYRPDLNWQTYQSLLAVCAFLKDAIAGLRPRDMIDLQGFIWTTRA